MSASTRGPGSPRPIPDAERRDEAGAVPPACAEELADLGVEEDEACHVPLFGRPPLETGEQRRRRRVPRQQVEPRPDDEGRQRLHGLEQTQQAGANIVESVASCAEAVRPASAKRWFRSTTSSLRARERESSTASEGRILPPSSRLM